MDYFEIMNFCGFDLKKAHNMARQYGAKNFSEIIREERVRLTRKEQEANHVHTLPAKPCEN